MLIYGSGTTKQCACHQQRQTTRLNTSGGWYSIYRLTTEGWKTEQMWVNSLLREITCHGRELNPVKPTPGLQVGVLTTRPPPTRLTNRLTQLGMCTLVSRGWGKILDKSKTILTFFCDHLVLFCNSVLKKLILCRLKTILKIRSSKCFHLECMIE